MISYEVRMNNNLYINNYYLDCCGKGCKVSQEDSHPQPLCMNLAANIHIHSWPERLNPEASSFVGVEMRMR